MSKPIQLIASYGGASAVAYPNFGVTTLPFSPSLARFEARELSTYRLATLKR